MIVDPHKNKEIFKTSHQVMIFANKPTVTVREQQLIETRTNLKTSTCIRPSAWQRQIPGKDMGTSSYACKHQSFEFKIRVAKKTQQHCVPLFKNGHVFAIPHQRTSRYEFMGRIVRFPNLDGHARKEWPHVGKTSLLSLLSASTSVALTSWWDFNRVKGH